LTTVLPPRLTRDGPIKQRMVLIRADREVRYKTFMAVMNQLEREG
jgi:biopolymer transport protein ExbD